MTATADDLARRLVESPHWRWMPGMLATQEGYSPRRVLRSEDEPTDGWHHVAVDEPEEDGGPFMDCDHLPGNDYLPDLSDPATEGCLLRLAREAWGSSVDVEDYGTDSVRVIVGYDTESRGFRGATLGQALAHAILAAGEVRDA